MTRANKADRKDADRRYYVRNRDRILARRRENAERKRRYDRARYDADRLRSKIRSRASEYRRRFGARGAVNDLTDDELLAFYVNHPRSCDYCTRPLATLCIDHVDPGKGNTLSNLAGCCHGCNSSKGRRTPRDWGRAASGYRGRVASAYLSATLGPLQGAE